MLILVILAGIAAISCIFNSKIDNLILQIISGVSLSFLVILFIMVFIVHIDEPGSYEANKQLYNSLVYQLENNVYNSSTDIGKSELYKKITDWNTDLARGKIMQDNIWVGVFWNNYYDEFEFIKFPEGG